MKKDLKKLIVFIILLIPSYILSDMVCMLIIYVYAQITGCINEPGAEALPFLAIPIGLLWAPIVSMLLTNTLLPREDLE